MVNYHEVRKTLITKKNILIIGTTAKYNLRLVKLNSEKSVLYLTLELVESDGLILEAIMRIDNSNLFGQGSDKFIEKAVKRLTSKAMRSYTRDMYKDLAFEYVKEDYDGKGENNESSECRDSV